MASPSCDKTGGRPAARLDDKVSCSTHGSTSIVTGSPDILIDYLPAATMGDGIGCGSAIVEGSGSVLINGKPAAVIGCAISHGGTVVIGSATVVIGTTSGMRTAPLPEDTPGALSDEQSFSLAFDFSKMHAAGNHNGISYNNMPIRITDLNGAHVATIRTDERGVSDRFFTKEQQQVIAWVVASDHWEVIEEYEVIERV